MYRLRILPNGLFQIHSSRHRSAFEGSPLTLMEQSIRMGIPEHELNYAVHQLKVRQHDFADFNEYGQFLGTRRDPRGGPHGLGWQ